MRIFTSGGYKNGKSTYAQHLAKKQSHPTRPLYYVATMTVTDNEDVARIKRHQNEREGWGFITKEQPKKIENILIDCDTNGSFLLDSLTALLANEMFSPTGAFDSHACERVAVGLTSVLSRVRDIVVVSDYIFSDAFLYDTYTEQYRQSLAMLDRLVAKHCEVVLEAAYTQIITHKGVADAIH